MMTTLETVLKYALCLIALWAIILLPIWLPQTRHHETAVAVNATLDTPRGIGAS